CFAVSPTCPYEKTADAYPVYTDVVQMTGIISEQSCESFCTTYPNFNCRSFAYYPSNGQCFISGEDRVSAGPASTNSRPGILFYERSCKDGVGGTGTTDGGGGTTSPGGGPSTGGGHSPTNSPTFPTAQPPQTPTLFPPTGNQESVPRTSLHRQGSQCKMFCYLKFAHPSGTGCLDAAAVSCQKLWSFERMIDQELRGVSPKEVTRFITLHDCERRCFEERRFQCKAASFDVNLQECRLYSDDRNSRFARLIYGRGVFYLENQSLTANPVVAYFEKICLQGKVP
ncbi:unnamed protein product, partial [Ixodes hexagonus]